MHRLVRASDGRGGTGWQLPADLNGCAVTGLRAMPVIGVRDVRAAAAFYAERLGFEVAGVWTVQGDDGTEVANFAIVRLDTVTIGLQWNAEVVPGADWAAYVYVDDVDGYAAGLTARGTAIARAPQDAPYGCRDMDVRDLDGHLIAFGQDLDPGPAGPGL